MDIAEQVTVAILAGGQSRRMGSDKSFVPLVGKPLVQHVIERAQILDTGLMIITNSPEKFGAFGLPLYQDVLPNSGSLGGVYTALHYSPTEYVLCVACDMPFINSALLQYIASFRHGYDAVVPWIAGRPEGLFAMYNWRCMVPIQEQIERRELRISRLFQRLHTLFVPEEQIARFDPELRSFINLNTPENLAHAEEWLR